MPAVSNFKDAENITMFELPSGKNLKIVKIDNTSLFGVRFHEGGELPKELDGKWTDVTRAVKAIKRYIEIKEAEVAKKAKVKAPAGAK